MCTDDCVLEDRGEALLHRERAIKQHSRCWMEGLSWSEGAVSRYVVDSDVTMKRSDREADGALCAWYLVVCSTSYCRDGELMGYKTARNASGCK